MSAKPRCAAVGCGMTVFRYRDDLGPDRRKFKPCSRRYCEFHCRTICGGPLLLVHAKPRRKR